jgi:leucyl aminopeptidase
MKLHLTTTKVSADIKIIPISKVKKDNKILQQLDFKAKDTNCVILPEQKVLYVGFKKNDTESLKIALATAIKKLKSTNYKSAYIKLKYDLASIVQGLELGAYEFNQYKSSKSQEKKNEKDKEQESKELDIYIKVDKINKKIQQIFEEAQIVANGVNMVRDFVNTAPDDFYPSVMAQKAIQIAQDNKIECKVLDEEYFASNNMGAIMAVGKASIHKPKLIHLSYKPTNPKKKIVLVGKGLTYDSGGLSLKPSDFMVTMKSDKSGGSAVLGIIDIVAKLNLPIELHGVIGAVENMIGGNAYKPDDILKAKDGTTIEVKNTDAEGRLVLADCLCYAQDEIEDIDCILDFATLTGACVVGVGEYTSGVMGNNNPLNYKFVQSALDSGELATTLPFNRYLKETLKSEIADICNISNTRYGGAITAGLFLEHFIQDKYKEKWIHIDIAGPAYAQKSWGYNPYGASGAGVRMTVEFLKRMIK